MYKRSEDPSLRVIVAQIISELDASPYEPAPARLDLRDDPAKPARSNAIRALLQTGGHAAAPEIAVIKLLDDKDELIRGVAVDYLSQIIPSSKMIVQALVRTAVTDRDPYVAANAAAALFQDG